MWLDTQLIPLKDKNGKTYAVMGISRDITHRRTIEDALRKSEEKYRAMVENISDVIFIVDKEGQINYMSPAIEKITSYKQAEIMGSTISTFVHPEDLDVLMDRITKGFLSHEPSSQEFRIFDKDGSLKYLRTSGQTLIKDGQVMGVTGVFSDITKSKMMEAALKDSEQRLKAVLYGSPIPAFVIDKNHKVLYWNKALEKTSRINAEELIGTDEHWKAFYPEKRPCMADILVLKT